MKLIVGLGNVGDEHKDNRHNVGFMVVDTLASKVVSGQWTVSRKFHCSLFTVHRSLLLARPTTFMNNSGKAVASLATYYKLPATSIYVIHDDLDIALGEYKIQRGKGPKDHGGLISIDKTLSTRDYWHVRIGIENRSQNLKLKTQSSKFISGEKYVLQSFTKEELEIINSVTNNVIKELSQHVLN